MLSKISSEASLRRNPSSTIPTTDMATTKADFVLNLHTFFSIILHVLVQYGPICALVLISMGSKAL
jgi:hypothetical protein